MRKIQLTRGYVAIVDDEDYERVIAAGPWHAHVQPHTVYAVRHVHKPDGGRTTQRLHRFILGIATDSENAINRRIRSGMSSKYRGVSWCRRPPKWHAQIEINGRGIHLGYFTDEVTAALAYDKAARAHFGEFAHCNFPPEDTPASNAAPSSLAVIA